MRWAKLLFLGWAGLLSAVPAQAVDEKPAAKVRAVERATAMSDLLMAEAQKALSMLRPAGGTTSGPRPGGPPPAAPPSSPPSAPPSAPPAAPPAAPPPSSGPEPPPAAPPATQPPSTGGAPPTFPGGPPPLPCYAGCP
jgi:hypothetical protein